MRHTRWLKKNWRAQSTVSKIVSSARAEQDRERERERERERDTCVPGHDILVILAVFLLTTHTLLYTMKHQNDRASSSGKQCRHFGHW